MPAAFAAIRPLYGSRAALFATGLVATCAEMVDYSANARGYSLVTLAFLLLIILAERLRHSPSVRDRALYSIVTALAMWTVPTALYPVGGVSLWLALSLLRRRAFPELRAFVGSMLAAAALTVALYLPALEHSGLAALVHNEVVAPSPWPVFLSEMWRSVGDTLWFWDRGMPALVAVLLGACALVAIVRYGDVSRDDAGFPYVVAVWCAVLLALNHRAPQVRVWQWLVPLAAAMAGAGVVYLIDRSPRVATFTARRFPAWVAAFAAIAAVSLIGSGL
jgi:hypothetical protein